jgi:hypothetical protein
MGEPGGGADTDCIQGGCCRDVLKIKRAMSHHVLLRSDSLDWISIKRQRIFLRDFSLEA